MISNLKNKSFSLTFEKANQGFVYNINCNQNSKTKLSKLEFNDEALENGGLKRTFYLNDNEVNDLLYVTVGNGNINLNRYVIKNDKISVQKNMANISYRVIEPNADTSLDLVYYNNSKKEVCLLNADKKEEIYPTCSFDKDLNQIKGNFKLLKNNKYILLNLNNK